MEDEKLPADVLILSTSTDKVVYSITRKDNIFLCVSDFLFYTEILQLIIAKVQISRFL